MTVTVSYTDGQNTAESVTSAATTSVANVNDAATVAISGTATEDQVLTATVTDEDGATGTITYTWARAGTAISGATSSATSAVANVNDDPTGSVTVTGTAQEDETLGIATSQIADEDGLGTFAYQWNRAGTAISGANGLVYTLTQSDVNSAITVTVSYTDGEGTAESVTSAATSAVANVNDATAGAVTITGTVAEDSVLTAVTSALSDEDGLGSFSYQWARAGTAFS